MKVIKNDGVIARLELLIVEDTPQHLEDAKAFFAPLVKENKVLLRYATDYASAWHGINNHQFRSVIPYFGLDGVITDVFMPSGIQDDKELDREVLEELYDMHLEHINRMRELNPNAVHIEGYLPFIESWRSGRELAPMGVLVAKKGKEHDIPVVAISDLYHHGKKAQVTHELLHKIGHTPWVDSGWASDDAAPAKEKDWEQAYETLLWKIK